MGRGLVLAYQVACLRGGLDPIHETHGSVVLTVTLIMVSKGYTKAIRSRLNLSTGRASSRQAVGQLGAAAAPSADARG